jgi:hypothetical protein
VGAVGDGECAGDGVPLPLRRWGNGFAINSVAAPAYMLGASGQI